jgi:hypothetical protein
LTLFFEVYQIKSECDGSVKYACLEALLNLQSMQRITEESAKSDLAKAIRYTLNHWNELTVFLADGRVEVDSNIVERTIRSIVLGRRNALFAGSTRGAGAWAVLDQMFA